MARVINNIQEHYSNRRTGVCTTVITFRTQQLFDLWENEMQGQISDGMWENCRNTEWLWRDAAVRLGNETKVEYAGFARTRTSYPLTKELMEYVGDRMMDENGFETEAELKAAWKEIATAIRNVSRMSDETCKWEAERRAAAKVWREAQEKPFRKAVEALKTPNNPDVEIVAEVKPNFIVVYARAISPGILFGKRWTIKVTDPKQLQQQVNTLSEKVQELLKAITEKEEELESFVRETLN